MTETITLPDSLAYRANRVVRCTEHDHILRTHGNGQGITTYVAICPLECPSHDPAAPKLQ